MAARSPAAVIGIDSVCWRNNVAVHPGRRIKQIGADIRDIDRMMHTLRCAMVFETLMGVKNHPALLLASVRRSPSKRG